MAEKVCNLVKGGGGGSEVVVYETTCSSTSTTMNYRTGHNNSNLIPIQIALSTMQGTGFFTPDASNVYIQTTDTNIIFNVPSSYVGRTAKATFLKV